MSTEKQMDKGVKCCGGCPFKKSNFGKETPNPELTDYDWYSEENMKRLWDGLRDGEDMVCHSSDPDSVEYGSECKIKDSHTPHLCYGALLVIFRHAKAFEKMLNEHPDSPDTAYKNYVRQCGSEKPMTMRGLTEFIMKVNFGRTSLLGGLPMPKNIKDDDAVGLPWVDRVGNKKIE